MNNAKAQPAKTQIFGLVRDGNGRPVVDDGETLTPEILVLLTDSEKEELKHDRFAFRRNS